MRKFERILWTSLVLIGFAAVLSGQQQQSGGGGSSVTITGALPAGTNVIGKVGIDQTTPGTTNLVSIGTNGTVAINAALPAGANSIGTVVNGTGTANIGYVRSLPSGCTQATNFTSSTVGVATGAGTSVTSTTTCVSVIYVNNITNSAVTFRLADKTGTPIIWIGGNADYTIPPNSNVQFPLNGVTMTSGITAIAGTAAALNLMVNGLQ